MKKKMNKNLTVGLWLTGIMLTLILVGFFWTPYNPETRITQQSYPASLFRI